MKIYCLSGLGIDERVFQFLELRDHKLIHIKWIKPLDGETITDYASRLLTAFDTNEPFAIMGLSFGGMIAMEIAKKIYPQKLFIISSIVTPSELPKIYKIGGYLKLHQLLPFNLLKRLNFLTGYLFGINSNKEMQFLKDILNNIDSKYVKWALGAILKWRNEKVDCVRIHGSNDHIFPISKIGKVDYLIKDTGHFLIVNKADQVSKIIKNELKDLSNEMKFYY